MALSERDRRVALIGGGIVGGLVLIFLVTRLLGGGGDVGSFSIPTGPVAPGGGNTGSATPTPTPSVVVSFCCRDPFAVPSVLQTATATPSSSSSTSTSSSGSPSPTTTAPGGGSSHLTADGKTVVLLDTFTQAGTDEAQVQVGGSTYTVAEGQTFAGGNFEVRSIAGDCATIDHGEEGFTLCTNPQQ